jgi:hypothetical protein
MNSPVKCNTLVMCQETVPKRMPKIVLDIIYKTKRPISLKLQNSHIFLEPKS